MHRPPSATRARGLLTFLAVVTAAVALVTGGPAGASPPPVTDVVDGFAPIIATGIDADPDDLQYGLDVDRLGNTYVATGGALVSMRSPSGAPVRTITAQGSGTVEPRGLVVSDVDLSVTVIGDVVGTVTVGTAPNQVTLDGGFTGAQFLVQFDRHGEVRWGRTFGGSNLNVFGLDLELLPPDTHEGFEVLLVHGQYTGSVEIDGIEVVQTPDGVISGILGSFLASDGGARWLTAIDLAAPDDVDAPIVLPEGAAVTDGTGLFAMVGSIGGAAVVRGPSTVLDLACGAPADTSCNALVAVSTRTGEPHLARSLGTTDETVVDRVDVNPWGYVVAGAPVDPAPGIQDPFIGGLDHDGDLVWGQTLGGEGFIDDVAFDSTRGVVAVATASSDLVLGAAPGVATVPLVGASDLVVVELTADGSFTRWTHAGGAGAATRAAWPGPALRLGADDRIVVTGDHDGPIEVGAGPGAIPLAGAGSFLAAFTPDAPPAGSAYLPLDPVRVLDSRTQTGFWQSPLVAGTPREVEIGGVDGIPENATAVVLNLTATDVTDMTYLTAWPTGGERPTASFLNAEAGQTIANHVTVPMGANGRITLANAVGSANVVVDVLGVFTPENASDRYHSVAPTRILDSRTGLGGLSSKIPANGSYFLQVAGPGAVPPTATAAVLSLTATGVTEDTFVEVHPANTVPTGSNLNLLVGETRTNLVTTKLAPNGYVAIGNNSGAVDVVVDVVGYYSNDPGGSLFRPIAPTRVLDSRFGLGSVAAPWGPGETRTVPVSQVVPGGSATAIAANLTATNATSISYATLFPEVPRPDTSNLLFDEGWTVAAAVNSGVGTGGTVSLFNQLGSAQFVLDVTGYFAAP
jgi:hypothetical protein